MNFFLASESCQQSKKEATLPAGYRLSHLIISIIYWVATPKQDSYSMLYTDTVIITLHNRSSWPQSDRVTFSKPQNYY